MGGPGCPGVLILKKWYFTNDVPNEIGGGTIHYVGLDRHRFTYILTDKEEGGTPNVLGDIKLGLVLHLHVCHDSLYSFFRILWDGNTLLKERNRW